MTRKDHQIIFTAMGFLAVILRDEVAHEKPAKRATGIARLIETFCISSVSDAFADEHHLFKMPSSKAEQLLELYIAELRDIGSVRPAFDRQTLLRMYELLMIQKMRHEQEGFYAAAYDDVIAESVLHLAEEQIRREAKLS